MIPRTLVAFTLLLACGVSTAEEFVFVPGVKEPTPEEIAAFRRISTRITAVRLNPLGLQRCSGALPVGPAAGSQDAVTYGLEIIGIPEAQSPLPVGGDLLAGAPHVDVVTASGEPVVGAFPGQVDNSLLNWFPPVRSQGGLGSCASFSTTYYQMTHMTAMARGWDAKNGGDAYRMSPKWAYNLVNGGSNSGSSMGAPISIQMNAGAATWDEFPYDGDFRAWCLNGNTWRNAVRRRIAATGTISGLDSDEGLDILKALLVNGYVLTFSTYVNSWVQATIPDDLSTADDDPWVGQFICSYQNGYNGSHGMTIVGYNDYIWCDLNGNSTVDDGEKGALKIANSWGTGDWNGGFRWISYDALKRVSSVPGGPTAGRAAAFTSAYWITARPSYTPQMIGVFTVNHPRRNQMGIRTGKSSTSDSDPETVKVVYHLNNNGGAYAFDGSSTPCDGAFAVDFTDLEPDQAAEMRYYLGMQDNAIGPEEGLIKSFELQDADGTVLAAYTGPEVAVADSTTEYVYIDYACPAPPVTVTVAAQDASASEAGPDSGTFRITLSGVTAVPLDVDFALAGSASQNVDYLLKSGTTSIAGTVTIPAGSDFADLSVEPIDDWKVEGAETVEIEISPGAGYAVGAPASAIVSIADDDTVQIVSDCDDDSTMTDYIYVPEGASSSFRIRLSAAPASDVTVKTMAMGSDMDVSVSSGGTLVFTSSDWASWQAVTLSSAEDADTFGGYSLVQCSAAGVETYRIQAVEIDNDSCNLLLDKYAVDVPEGGSAVYQVKCSMAPAADFTVEVKKESGDDDISVSGGASLSFGPADWNSWKTVTLSAAEDLDGYNGAAVIMATPSDSTVGWGRIVATEADNDVPGPGILLSQSEVSVMECMTSTFQVRLSGDPGGSIAVNVSRLSGDADIVVKEGAALDFDSANWCQWRTVTLEALQDPDALNGTAVIECLAPGIADARLTAKEMDRDAPRVVTDVWGIAVLEGGSAGFSVRLSRPPQDDVTLAVTHQGGDADISVSSGASLLFTPSDWDSWQPVTVSAAEDADTANGWANFVIEGDGVDNGWMSCNEIDNDVVNILVGTTNLAVAEGSSASLQVRLSADPGGNCTVDLAVSGDSDISVTSGPSLTFDSGDWQDWQTVTIAAAEDADSQNGFAQLTFSATGLNSVFVQLSETDNDILDIVVDASLVMVPEGGTAQLQVRLSGPPSESTGVRISLYSGDADVEVSSSDTLTFSSANWDSWQPVTFAAAEDPDSVDGWTYFQLFGFSGHGLNQLDVTAVELDNDGGNSPPVAYLSGSPTAGCAPLAVLFDAAGSSDDGSITLYEYDFDFDGVLFEPDDSGAALTATSHTYVSAGTYVAAVRVADNGFPALHDVDTVVVVVDPPDSAPPGIVVDAIVVEGTASDDSGTVSVTVGGAGVPVTAGAFSGEASLSGLPDTVIVQATDPALNTATIELAVDN
ncbi:MAG: hypothetical protein JW909_01085 [Planctomycetes bacterium]|nr:hypothetical protein [Planctomycetota bacterium]